MNPGPEACDACLQRAWTMRHLPGAEASAPERGAGERRAALGAAGLWACCEHDPGFPAVLRDAPQPPPALFGRGDHAHLARLGEPEDAVTVVGARRPTAYGRELAESLGRELAVTGLVVVSGMAMGIDSCAHAGALTAGGVTVAVLGGGAEVASPARMKRLYDSIVERGLVLSELPPGTLPMKWTFPARNRIMAALAAMTVVVEARERSGSLITASMAADLGREVGAVPGRVGNSSSAGTNSLLRDGAHVVRGGQDVLDSLLGAGALAARVELAPAAGPPLDSGLRAALAAVESGAATTDAIGSDAGLSPGEAGAAVTRLELLGYLGRDSAGRIERTGLEAPATRLREPPP